MRKTILTIIILLFVFSTKVNALNIEDEINEKNYYINEEGISVDKESYEKLKVYMSDKEINSLSEKEYNYFKDMDNIVAYDSIEFSEYYDNGRKYIVAHEIGDRSIQIAYQIKETNMKRIRIYVKDLENGTYEFLMNNYWKSMPQTREYDIFAMRWTNTNNVSISNKNGTQDYRINGVDYDIEYGNNSNNFKVFNNGFGLSQNLVDGSTYYFQTMKAITTCAGTTNLYGTYQHATSYVSLSDSKQYTLGSTGMGGVILFTYQTTENKYDNTEGLHVSFTC